MSINWNDLLTEDDKLKLAKCAESMPADSSVGVDSFTLIARLFPSLVPYILDGSMSAEELREWTQRAKNMRVLEQLDTLNILITVLTAVLNGDKKILDDYIKQLKEQTK